MPVFAANIRKFCRSVSRKFLTSAFKARTSHFFFLPVVFRPFSKKLESLRRVSTSAGSPSSLFTASSIYFFWACQNLEIVVLSTENKFATSCSAPMGSLPSSCFVQRIRKALWRLLVDSSAIFTPGMMDWGGKKWVSRRDLDHSGILKFHHEKMQRKSRK